jgi:hypothetical protein
MKKCTAIIFYSALFLLFSCTGEKKENAPQVSTIEKSPITTDTIKIYEDYTFAYDKANAPRLTIDITLPRIDLGNEQANARLDSTLVWGLFFYSFPTLQDACNFHIASRKEIFNELKSEYHNLKESGIPPGMMGCYCNIKGRTVSGYNGYISYIMTQEEYYGGAHPTTFTTIANFDSKTGAEINLSDIFKEGYEEILYTKLIDKLLEDNDASTIEELCQKGYTLDIDFFITNNFILGQDSITFLYNRYEIAPYAMGDILISLDYKTLKEIMK